jgi:signal transduction histidine kinase
MWAVAARFVAGALAVAAGVTSLTFALRSPSYSFAGSALGAVALLAAGSAVVTAGIVFWTEQPHTIVGPSLVAGGVLWLLAEWDSPATGASFVFTVGLVAQVACPAFVALAVFAHPSGQVRGRAVWFALAGLAVGTVALVGVLATLWYDPRAQGCTVCPANGLLIGSDPTRAASLARAGFRVGAVAASALVLVAAWRVARSSPTKRRVLAPCLVAGSAFLVVTAWVLAASADRGYVGSGALERRLWYAQAAALVAIAAAVLSGRIRNRRTRRSLVDIVVELGKATSSGGLRDALAVRLRDPGLDVAYAVGEERWVDRHGAPVAVEAGADRAATPLVRDGVAVATVLHRVGALDDTDLVREVASSVRLLLENERLQAEARVREAELRASRSRIVEAGDTARRRLERDLHDGAQQRLVGLMLGIRLLARETHDRHPDVATRLVAAERALGSAIDRLRVVANGIHPGSLTAFGLSEALRSLAERSPHAVDVAALPENRLPLPVETCVYHIVAESAAGGPVVVDAGVLGGVLRLDVATTVAPAALIDLEDRVGALDGRLEVRSTVDGVVLRAEVPCAS